MKVVPETIKSLDPGEEKTFSLEVAQPRTIFGGEQYIWVKVQARAAGVLVMDSDGFIAVLNRWRIMVSV